MASLSKAMEIVLKTLLNHLSENPGCDRNHAAAAELYERRNDPNQPHDEDLALAEHYLVARAYVSCGQYSATQQKMMVLAYYAAKKQAETAGSLQGMRHNPNKPVTPPSYKQVIMGLGGVMAGERDLKEHPPSGKKAPLYKSVPNFVGARSE